MEPGLSRRSVHRQVDAGMLAVETVGMWVIV